MTKRAQATPQYYTITFGEATKSYTMGRWMENGSQATSRRLGRIAKSGCPRLCDREYLLTRNGLQVAPQHRTSLGNSIEANTERIRGFHMLIHVWKVEGNYYLKARPVRWMGRQRVCSPETIGGAYGIFHKAREIDHVYDTAN